MENYIDNCLDKYITERFVNPTNLLLSVNNLELLSVFLEQRNIDLSIKDIEAIINNIVLLKTIKVFLDNSTTDKFEKLLKNENLSRVFGYFIENCNYENDYDSFYYSLNEKDVSDDNFDDYMKQISNYPLLTYEQTIELFKKLKNNDPLAKEKLIKSNLKLVVKIAKNYLGQGIEFLDLIQEGNIGLMVAVDRFDIDKNTTFSTYAFYWIKAYITKALSEKSKLIRLSSTMIRKLRIYFNAIQKLGNQLCTSPTIEEISKETGFSEDEVIELFRINEKIVSLSDMITPDSDTTIEEFIDSNIENPADLVDNYSLGKAINELLEKSNLTEKEIEILKMRYGFYGDVESFREIGEKYNATRQRIKQIDDKIIIKLRCSDYANKLLDFSNDIENANCVLKKAREENPKILKKINKENGNR